MGGLYVAGDTLSSDSLHLWCYGTGGIANVRMFQGVDLDNGTAMMASTQVTTSGGKVTLYTWTVADASPGNRVWMEITAITAKPILILADWVYHKK